MHNMYKQRLNKTFIVFFKLQMLNILSVVKEALRAEYVVKDLLNVGNL